MENDHDLLIALKTTVDIIHGDLKANHIQNSERIAKLEITKADDSKLELLLAQSLKQRDDHERRIRSLERWGWAAIGSLYIINILIAIFGHMIK